MAELQPEETRSPVPGRAPPVRHDDFLNNGWCWGGAAWSVWRVGELPVISGEVAFYVWRRKPQGTVEQTKWSPKFTNLTRLARALSLTPHFLDVESQFAIFVSVLDNCLSRSLARDS